MMTAIPGPNDDDDQNADAANPDDHDNRQESEIPDDRGNPDDH